MTKFIIETLDTLRANHVFSLRRNGEDWRRKDGCQSSVVFFICLSMLYVGMPTARCTNDRNCQAVFVSDGGTGRSKPLENT